jgi:RNA polymerase sigma factor (sigma-70 family)
MEVSALKYSGGVGLHARSPLLRLQSDERLVVLVRRGSGSAFEVLVSRYEGRLLAFCRHLLGSREDAEDVLQEVFAAAFAAMTADQRPINVRPWLYRIARNRSLNHLRRMQAVGVDSMDVHYSDNGASTADKAHEREEFRLLVGDINELPETQKTALVLREMDALSYEQIAEAMDTSVPSVKSLLVRARISLAEAAEARVLSCEEVRLELGEVAEGLRRRPSPLVRRHLRGCKRCASFRGQLKQTNKALAAIMPLGPLVILKKLALTHLSHSASSSATSAAGSSAAAGTTLIASSTTSGFITASISTIATKAAAGLAAAALVTAGAVEVDHSGSNRARRHTTRSLRAATAVIPVIHAATTWATPQRRPETKVKPIAKKDNAQPKKSTAAKPTLLASVPPPKQPVKPTVTTAAKTPAPVPATPLPGRTQTQTDPTVLPPAPTIAAPPPYTPPPPPTTAAVIPPPAATTTSSVTSTGSTPPPPPSAAGSGAPTPGGGAPDTTTTGSTTSGSPSATGTTPTP